MNWSFQGLHECFEISCPCRRVADRRTDGAAGDLNPPNREFDQTGPVSGFEAESDDSVVYIHTARQVHAWIGVGDSETTKPNSARRLARLDILEFGLVL